jgi:ferredoxin-NADP reductase
MTKSIEHSCIVQRVRMLTPTVFELAFDVPEMFVFEAGQFISVVIPGAGPAGRDLRRAYSIASPPEVRPIELCVKLIDDGPGSPYLRDLQAGDTFRSFAPYGNFVFKPKQERHACFIATGTGIAPFRSMILSKSYQESPPIGAWCLLGVRDESELLYTQEMSRALSLKWIPAITRPGAGYTGFKGRVTDYLRSQSAEFPWLETDYYVCGNGEMIREVKELLLARGVTKESIHHEKYY